MALGRWRVHLHTTDISKDKLIAIAGLARQVYIDTGVRYFAGLWGDRLEVDLLWYRQWPNDTASFWWTKNEELISCLHLIRPVEYRAPSWSWAAASDSVRTFERSGHTTHPPQRYVEAFDARIEPPNSFGEVTAGSLKLRCCSMIKGLLRRFAIPSFWGHSRFQLGVAVTPTLNASTYFDVFPDYPLDCEHNKIAYIVPFFYLESRPILFGYHGVQLQGSTIGGLVLQPTGKSQGQYKRLGVFEYLHQGVISDLSWLDSLWRDCQTHSSPLSLSDFVCSEWGNGKEYGIIELI